MKFYITDGLRTKKYYYLFYCLILRINILEIIVDISIIYIEVDKSCWWTYYCIMLGIYTSLFQCLVNLKDSLSLRRHRKSYSKYKGSNGNTITDVSYIIRFRNKSKLPFHKVIFVLFHPKPFRDNIQSSIKSPFKMTV